MKNATTYLISWQILILFVLSDSSRPHENIGGKHIAPIILTTQKNNNM